MRLRIVVLSMVLGAALPVAGWGQAARDARSIMDEMRERQVRRWSGTENYVVITLINESFVGANVVLMNRVSSEVGFRQVPPHEITAAREELGGLSASRKDSIADGMVLGLDMITKGREPALGGNEQRQMAGWVLGFQAFMHEGGRSRKLEDHYEGAAEAKAAVEDMATLAGMLTLAGPLEEVGGRTAYHLDAKGVNRPLKGGFTLQQVQLWVDSEHFVPLRLRMTGDYRASDGKMRQVTIEREDADYVPVGSLLEPRRQRFKLSGMLSPKEQAELAASKKKMDEQRAKLSPAQKEQVMRMMGPQIRQMEAMAKQGNADVEMELIYKLGGIEMYLEALGRVTNNGAPPKP